MAPWLLSSRISSCRNWRLRLVAVASIRAVTGLPVVSMTFFSTETLSRARFLLRRIL